MNLRIPESKSGALPLGDTPMFLWGGRWESNPRPSGPQSDALTNCATPAIALICNLGAPEGTRTPDTRLRRAVLYPAELQAQNQFAITASIKHLAMSTANFSGAGDGNRTHATSLEGWCSTIELHPHLSLMLAYFNKIRKICQPFLYRFKNFF